MSVLIKGMEMPNSCHECPLGFGGGCYMGRSADEYMCPDSGRAEWCPLVPVPEHGDLIDRDALDVMSWKEDEAVGCFSAGVLFVLDRVDALPTIIEAERSET